MQTEANLASVYTDMAGIANLRHQAATDSDAAKREVAQQFESLYTQLVIKTMRQAIPKDDLFGSSQMDTYTEMHDQQLAVSLAQTGSIGIAQLVYKQLGGEGELPTRPGTAVDNSPMHHIAFATQLWGQQQGYKKELETSTTTRSINWDSPRSFIESIRPAAAQAAARLGTAPEAIIAIAALETGWGSHVMKNPNGSSSFNLFGIKADRSWSSNKVMASTLEFEDGAMQRRQEPFRSYRSVEDAVADFANFIQQNPRYRQALKNAANPERFIQELHKAGYATDPNYSEKVNSVMKQIQTRTQANSAAADNVS